MEIYSRALYIACSLFGMSVRFGCLMQGVQTFFTTNHEGARPKDSAAHLESWGFYPDAKPVRSFYDGDPRAAIAPFQAYKSALLITPQLPVDCTKPCLSFNLTAVMSPSNALSIMHILKP